MCGFNYLCICAGEPSIQQANQKRFEDRVLQLFNQFKEQRLTQAALQCEQLINKASTQLTQVMSNAFKHSVFLDVHYRSTIDVC